MRKIKFTPVVLIVLVLALALAAGSTYAKYATTKYIDGTLTVTANLGSIAMIDGNIEKKLIIPGVDIPVNHKVIISDKSSIPAYVYLEVKSNISPEHKLSFAPSNQWQAIRSTTAGGKTTTVYVYVGDGSTPVAVDSDVTIPVAGLLQVSQYVTAPSSVDLKFTAKMYQTAAGNNATEVYESCSHP